MNNSTIIEDYKNGISQKFYKENDILYYRIDNSKVNNLSVLIDFKDDKVVLKYGEYNDILPYYYQYQGHSLFDVKIINIPKKMYFWVDIIYEFSASKWIDYLILELEQYNKDNLKTVV